MLNVIVAPNEIPYGEIKVFLGGGICNCPDWQKETIKLLEKSHGNSKALVFNPRRAKYPANNSKATKEQITWEYRALNNASIFTMWFCNSESDQPICMYELGRHLERFEQSAIAVGVEPGYNREQDVYIQTRLKFPNMHISTTLEEHASNISNIIVYQQIEFYESKW